MSEKQYMTYPHEHARLGMLVESCLDGKDYGRGIAEAASATAENATSALGDLIEVLHEKGVLSLEEVGWVLGLYTPIELVEKDGDA